MKLRFRGWWRLIADSEIKTAAGVNYTYDGDGNRVQKSNGKIYWYGAGSQVLDESDLSGNITDEYVYFGGKRVAHRDSGGSIYYYAEDFLGTSRVLTNSSGVVCYDADFYPFGGERVYINTCAQNYKFTGKERDAETGNDNFGARYYASNFGRWLSADWSAIPAPVPYADLTNPQTLNLYQYVKNDPESFTDPDGHSSTLMYQLANTNGGFWDPTFATTSMDLYGLTEVELDAMFAAPPDPAQQQNTAQQQPGQPTAQNQTTLNLNGTNVDVTFNAVEFSNGQKGAVIDANPQGTCDNCRWAQTVTRTGDPAQPTHTDREAQSGAQPLYPGGVHAGNDAANLSDRPRSSNPGTFTAVSTLGVADKANKTFKVTGSMTWGYKIDKNGNVSGLAPRVATKAEQARSIAVLRRESPTWTITP
jgi:RHS repeat-associated protein